MRKLILTGSAIVILSAAFAVRADDDSANPPVAGQIDNAALPSQLAPARERKGRHFGKSVALPKSAQQNDLATITYDTGSYDALPTLPAAGFFIGPRFVFGNRFALGDAMMETASYTVTGVSVFMAMVDSSAGGNGDATVSFYEPPSGGSAGFIGLHSASGLQAGTFNQVPITGATGLSGPEILAGILEPQSASTAVSVPCAVDCVGLDGGTVNGFGHNAFHVTYFGASYADIPGYNAMIRLNVGGTLPVELMSFTVE